MMLFSNASLVRILDTTRSSFTISTILRPLIWANTFLLESAAGIAAFSGRVSPSDSTIQAMVEAVPITAQWPWLRHIQASAVMNSSWLISPRRLASLKRQMSVVPMSLPRYFPLSIGPPETKMVGRSTLVAPIRMEGVVLSQPPNSTTPSMGFALMLSSASMLARLR